MLDFGSVGTQGADGEQYVAAAGSEEFEGGREAFWVWAAQWEGESFFASTDRCGIVREDENVMADLSNHTETLRREQGQEVRACSWKETI